MMRDGPLMMCGDGPLLDGCYQYTQEDGVG